MNSREAERPLFDIELGKKLSKDLTFFLAGRKGVYQDVVNYNVMYCNR